MKVLKEKKIEESTSYKTLSELRENAWALANGMSLVDDLKSDCLSLIMALNQYFEAIGKNDIEKAKGIYKVYISRLIDKIQKNVNS